MIHSGMVYNVNMRVHAALVQTLNHCSVWISATPPVMTLIEVRICHNQNTVDEDTPIQLLELYIQ